MQRAGGKDDDKLVEMINTTIVDRSPSVKWDDVGTQPLTFFVALAEAQYLLRSHYFLV